MPSRRFASRTQTTRYGAVTILSNRQPRLLASWSRWQKGLAVVIGVAAAVILWLVVPPVTGRVFWSLVGRMR